ncbi:MAG TPA: hypothetical protein VNF69_03390 [Burkholderiales bacterium]|nr:hypothetical protein [Burkholderiales bacterium]
MLKVIACLACILALAGPLGSGAARADPGWGVLRLYAQARMHMSREEREELRQQLRSADRNLYRNQQRGNAQRKRRFERQREQRLQRVPEGGRLSPEQRKQLRRDIMDSNRRFKRR